MSISNFYLEDFKEVYNKLDPEIKNEISFKDYMKSSTSPHTFNVTTVSSIMMVDGRFLSFSSKNVDYDTHNLSIIKDVNVHSWSSLSSTISTIYLMKIRGFVWLNHAHNDIYISSLGLNSLARSNKYTKTTRSAKHTMQWKDALKIILDVKPEMDLWISDCKIRYD